MVAGGDVVHEFAVTQGLGVQMVLLTLFLQLLEHLALFNGLEQSVALLGHLAFRGDHAPLLGFDVTLEPFKVGPVQADVGGAKILQVQALEILHASAPGAAFVPQHRLFGRQRPPRLRELFLKNVFGVATGGEQRLETKFEHGC